MPSFLPLFPFLLLLLLDYPKLTSQETLTSFSISDSPWFPDQNRTLASPDGIFAAGFFRTPSNSKQYVFSIRVESSTSKTIVWTLNDADPVDANASLSISPLGVLSLVDSSGKNLGPNATGASNTSKLELQNDGEMVFGNWSSFLSPTDTILANQKVPPSGTTLTSGLYALVNASSLVFNGSAPYWMAQNQIYNLTPDGQILMSSNSKYVAADLEKTPLRRLTLDADGNLRLYSLNATKRQWRVMWQAVSELCTIRGKCADNAICVPDLPVDADKTSCVCPPGYRNATDLSASTTCSLKLPLRPNSTNKFLRLDFVAFVDGPNKVDLTPLNFEECKRRCLTNSSCVGFSYKYGGFRTCYNHNKLVGGYWSPYTENAMFIRVANAETDVSTFTGMTTEIDTTCPVRISLPLPPKQANTTIRNIAIITALFVIELLAGVLSFWAFLRKYSKYRDMARVFGLEYLPAGGPKRFTYAELKAATNDFSNVVGRGGYGVVYKGELADRRVIAVKRLKNVGGGEAEFWAEVAIIARMHHLNLVRMWGFCAEKEQRMLVYEYVSNGSLDKFLFPPIQSDEKSKNLVPPRPLLDWNIRYRIAIGVARAIAYLHEECLEWVLHCDIKPENILLEDDFCPKVSDFGLSKLTNKKDKVTMSRIRGTRGYMAPEWVIQREPITAKADVYSFGMVLLEIVSGRRNYDFRQESLDSEDWYFPKWAFEKVYVERKVEDILDARILDSYDDRAHFGMVERMVKTAMWCLQDRAEMRPPMGKVAKMLEGTVDITEPAKPTIFCMTEE
ncbi:G-type lectin S-receptor-like serine/threonine-protein kinase At1g34300 [Typha latifolia]|uniref:G-type lectin S-receptor-like serine/threonine-protein kinase At1g34300 n=1 Tax=Typha latifolia TaxID=4733 RepID=UPI003C2DB6A9